MCKRCNILVYAICLIGLCVRLGYCLLVGDDIQFPDEKRFWTEAKNILGSGVLVWKDEYAHDMPLTALIIAVFVKITGAGIVGVRLLFAVISAMTIYVVSRLAGLLSENTYTPVVAAAITAFYPFFIYYSSLLLSETLFLFGLATYLFFLLRSRHNDHLTAGVCGGVVHLIRPSLYYFYPVVVFLQRYLLKYPWRKTVITFLLTILVIFPWAVRNQNILGKVVLGTTGTGQVLWEGNNPFNTTGGTSDSFELDTNYLEEMPGGLNELERDSWKKQKAIDYIKNNPKIFLHNNVKKFFRFWNLWPNHPDYSKPLYKYLSLLSFGPVLFGSLASLWLLRNRWRELGVLWLFILYYTALHMVSIGSIRYRLPLEPILVVLASCSYVRIYEIGFAWMKKSRGKKNELV